MNCYTIFLQSSLYHKVEEHVFCVEAKVDSLSSTVDTPTVIDSGLSESVGNLSRVMDEVISVIKKSLYFIILRVSYQPYMYVPNTYNEPL